MKERDPLNVIFTAKLLFEKLFKSKRLWYESYEGKKPFKYDFGDFQLGIKQTWIFHGQPFYVYQVTYLKT